MPPRASHLDSVVFVCAEDLSGEIVPGGTAFVVGVPGVQPFAEVLYFVTAKHVVRDQEETWIRLRRLDGTSQDVQIDRWVMHPTADVAAAPCRLDTSQYLLNWQSSVETFIDQHELITAYIGNQAFFIGLLEQVPSMHDRVIPMARGGFLGALSVPNIPMVDRRWDRSYSVVEPLAHLVDCYSRSGFSGSPMFIEQPRAHVRYGGQFVHLSTEIALLGVTIGHFGDERGSNEGVAVVVPIDFVRELLNEQSLTEWRES